MLFAKSLANSIKFLPFFICYSDWSDSKVFTLNYFWSSGHKENRVAITRSPVCAKTFSPLPFTPVRPSFFILPFFLLSSIVSIFRGGCSFIRTWWGKTSQGDGFQILSFRRSIAFQIARGLNSMGGEAIEWDLTRAARGPQTKRPVYPTPFSWLVNPITRKNFDTQRYWEAYTQGLKSFCLWIGSVQPALPW